MPTLDGEAIATLTLTVAGEKTLNKSTAGTNRVGVLLVGGWANGAAWTLSSVTWGGEAMTQASRSVDTTDNLISELWYIVNPPTASSVVAFTPSGGIQGGAVVASFNGVNQSTPFRAASESDGVADGTTPIGTVTSSADDLVVVGYGIYSQPAGVTPTWTDLTIAGIGGDSTIQGGLGTTSGASPTKSTNAGFTMLEWAVSMGSLQAPAAGGPTHPFTSVTIS